MAKTLREQYGFSGPADIKLPPTNARDGQPPERLEGLVGGAARRLARVPLFRARRPGQDIDGDELSDSLDEILCPYDLDWNHPFTDDDLAEICREVPGRGPFTVILDCCHSGTGLRNFLRPDLPIGTSSSRPPWRCATAPTPDREPGIDRSVTMIGPDKALSVRRSGSASRKRTRSHRRVPLRPDLADAWIDGDYRRLTLPLAIPSG
jgi:hypothetical protein